MQPPVKGTPHPMNEFSEQDIAENVKNDPLVWSENWWSLYRYKVVTKFLPISSSKQKLLDFGCGNCLFLHYLQKHGFSLSLSGYDPYISPLEDFHGNRIQAQQFSKLQDIPTGTFDLVTSLDCIEHIDDDKGALMQMYNLLKPDGKILVTVPAFQFLYSSHDAAVGHYRRYNQKQLKAVLEAAGFQVTFSAYFFPSLVPMAIFRRFYLHFKRAFGSKEHSMYIPQDRLGIFSLISRLDFYLMEKINFKLPVGFFIVAVARKKPN